MGINSRAELERRVVENGWVKSRGGDITMKLVDDTDTLYTYPRNIVKGCSCRKRPCQKCSCAARGGCTVKVCKCNCFQNLTTDEAGTFETATSEEDLPENFFEFDEGSDALEEVLNENNPPQNLNPSCQTFRLLHPQIIHMGQKLQDGKKVL